MSYYFLANISIRNPEEYKKYIEGSGDVFRKYKGRYLAVDDHPLVLEGTWDHTRVVLIEFPTEKEFMDWYESAEYQRIAKYRLNAADCNTILMKGIENEDLC